MRIKKEDIFFVLFSVITAIVFASYRCMNGDFVAYNGDFQNYNIFRRLMAGRRSIRILSITLEVEWYLLIFH